MMASDVALDEMVAGVVGYVAQVVEVAGIRQFIIDHQAIAGVFVEYVMHKISADKAGAACYQ